MAIRINAGFSQEELSQRIGVPQQTIAFWERTGKSPRSEVLPQLAEAIEALLSENGVTMAARNKGGPDGKLRRTFEEASRLPKRQQEKISELVSAYINQYKQSHSR